MELVSKCTKIWLRKSDKKGHLEGTGVDGKMTLTVQETVAQGRDQWRAPVNIIMNQTAKCDVFKKKPAQLSAIEM